METIMKTHPAVFAVGRDYQIMVPVTKPALFYVKVGDKCYYDHSNGIIRSNVTTHRVCVPMDELNEAGSYTVCIKGIIERKPYFPLIEDVQEYSYRFRPVKPGRAVCYHIADAHNLVETPVKAAKQFEEAHGKLDFLILNGDVPDHSGKIENFDNIYRIVSDITGGEIPAIFSRGNHDTRGFFAENIADHTPVDNGRSYFTFRLGDIWGIVMDTGEDKPDTNPEYNGTVCCHEFRLEETKFLESVIENAATEYAAPDVRHRIVIAHNPFTWTHNTPFDIEQELFTYWAKRLREDVKPEVMICGHTHQTLIEYPGGEHDALGHPCPIAIGSTPRRPKEGIPAAFAGMGMIFGEEDQIIFNNTEQGEYFSDFISLT
ncbi:MAG: metallophosphoesterase [Ruminococcaceae bacterium]|nr:metallophosphoesterase [Oscillospiraceae bacterium]